MSPFIILFFVLVVCFGMIGAGARSVFRYAAYDEISKLDPRLGVLLMMSGIGLLAVLVVGLLT